MAANNILGVIPARGDSKGVPRKNLLKLGDRSLLQRAVESARESKLLTRTIVSTEDPEIHAHAVDIGANVPFVRPDELSTDTSSSFDVLRHAVNWLQEHENWPTDIIVLLQPTTPFRTAGQIDGVIQLLLDSAADSAMAIRPVNYPPFWMFTKDDDCLELLVKNGNRYIRRQDTPRAYQPAGSVYALRRDLLFNLTTLLPTAQTRGFLVSAEDAVNIDEPLDWEIAQAVCRRRNQSG